MIVMPSPSPVRATVGPVIMELVEPALNMPIRDIVPFKVKIVAGNPAIIKTIRLELTQDRAMKTEPLEMGHIQSSPPRIEEFWYISIDASKLAEGRYDAKIAAYDLESRIVGELTTVVEIGRNSDGRAYRESLVWLGGLLAIASLIAYWQRV